MRQVGGADAGRRAVRMVQQILVCIHMLRHYAPDELSDQKTEPKMPYKWS